LCGSRKSTISPPATDVVYDLLLRCVAGGRLRPPAAAADQKNIKKSQKKGTQKLMKNQTGRKKKISTCGSHSAFRNAQVGKKS